MDDDPTLLKSLARALRAKGYEVAAVRDGQDAVALMRSGDFDAVVSDIAMPGMDGIQLLREAREHELYVPVILMTGEPTVGTAVKAVEFGAFHYLTKPTGLDELHRVLGRAVGLSRMARVKQEAAELLGSTDPRAADRAGLEASFLRAMNGLWVAFQPIITPSYRIFAYEALLRSDEPALRDPGAVIGAAERLNRLNELGRTVRDRAAAQVGAVDADWHLFVNCHPRDLMDEDLYDPTAALSRHATRVVLEVTERSSLEEVKDVRGRVAALREVGFRIAIDDFGAGYAGLTSFAQLEPEIVKIDLSIVRDVEKNHIKQKVIRSTATLAKDMGIQVVAEGVETQEERDCLVDLGVDLFQGFLFARPGRPFPTVAVPKPISIAR